MARNEVHLISLGAGVQSSTMALMAARGEILPMPTAAIFADTQAEPASVYRWLDWLEKQLPFPVHRVTAGSLRDRALEMRTAKDGRLWPKTKIPYYVVYKNGRKSKIPKRSCTRDFKLRPLFKASRRIAGIKRGQKTVGVIQWIGISVDEVHRMKPSREPWAEIRWPLIEKRFTRGMCLDWMAIHGYPEPPRSACVFCPFHHADEWRRLQVDEPEEFAKAVQFERDVQAEAECDPAKNRIPFLHKICMPLDQIDFRTDIELGQLTFDWQDECEGMCGV